MTKKFDDSVDFGLEARFDGLVPDDVADAIDGDVGDADGRRRVTEIARG